MKRELAVEYSEPKCAPGEFDLDFTDQVVTREDGTKHTRRLFADRRVVAKDGRRGCMWFGSPDEARKYAAKRADIQEQHPFVRYNNLYVPNGPTKAAGWRKP